MAQTTFSGPVVSANGFSGDIVGAVKLPTYDVAGAPSAATAGAGTLVYISDGAAGDPITAFSDGTDWKRSDTGATISAS